MQIKPREHSSVKAPVYVYCLYKVLNFYYLCLPSLIVHSSFSLSEINVEINRIT